MKVASLNNQSFQQTSKTSPLGKSARGKGSSFESLLGDVQERDTRDNSAQLNNAGSERDSKRQDDKSDSKQQQPQSQMQAKSQPQARRDSPAAPRVGNQPKSFAKQSAKRDPREDSVQTESVSSRAENSVRSENSVQTESAAPQDQNFAMSSAEDTEAQGLPNGQGAPSMGTPGLATERTPAGPQLNGQAANLNPLAAPAQQGVTDDAANTLTRRVVWNDFLRKMNDLGVSAEDVLKAFGSLSEKDLAQSPEQSLDKIVAALGLAGPQAVQAKTNFSELITKTKSKSLGEEINASSKQLSVTLASQRDLQRKAQAKSIDNLNNTFFMNKAMKPQIPQAEAPAIGPDGKPMVAPVAMPETAQQGMAQFDGQTLMPGNTFARPSIPDVIPQQPQATANGADVNGLVNQLQAQQQPVATEDKKSIDQLIKNFSARTAKAAPEMALAQGAAAPVAAQGMSTAAAAGDTDSRALSELNAILSGGRRREDETSGDGDDQSGPQLSDMSGLGDQRMTAGQPHKTDFQSTLESRNTQQAAPMAVPELVQQAQMMVKDGGGDMKVTLTPEGMGEVAVRVSVTDGKVNVTMITESDEAKKLIERGIGDLKGSLTQNHLQVDSIKVDTATNLGKQLEQQYQDAQRQQTQAQWEQFRQDGGSGWRRSFFDTGVVGQYRSQGDAFRDAQAPASAQAKARSSGGSRRLDLVA